MHLHAVHDQTGASAVGLGSDFMHIFLDESGVFVPTKRLNAWSSIAAYVLPEAHRVKMLDVLARLKEEAGAPYAREIKLKDLDEPTYFQFLSSLGKLEGILFSVLIDMGVHDASMIQEHQDGQVAGILRHIDKMRHPNGRVAIQRLADEVADLAPQLYVQLQCQVALVDTVVRSALLYFVQRRPETLGHFRWRIDHKDVNETAYERSFFSLTPVLLQSKSIREPLVTLEGADYGAFRRYEYAPGEEPSYLKDDYGIDSPGPDPGINIGKLFRDDFRFVDSKATPGVQVADLLSAGIRRTLREGFAANDHASRLLGGLMVQAPGHQSPARLIALSRDDQSLGGRPADLIRIMTGSARNMLRARTR